MSVEFEPVKLGPRRRRVDPALIGALAVVIAIAGAVVKPWEGDRPTTGGAAAVPAGPQSTPTTFREPGSGETGSGETASGLPVPTWPHVAPVLTRHDTWGVRAIAVDQAVQAADPTHASHGYAERWFAAAEGADGELSVFVESSDQSIVALGLTFPPDQTPLDARIWRVRADDQLEWLDARPIDPVPSGGAFLFVPPDEEGAPVRSWGAGRYRIDVLVDGSVRRISVAIPGRFGNVPRPRPSPLPDTTLTGQSDMNLAGLPDGLFATVEAAGVPLAGERSAAAFGEAEAWADADPGTGRAPRSHVATAYLPRATGIGVVLPAGSVVFAATVRRLVPDVRFDGPTAVGGELSDRLGPTPYVVFVAPDGGIWTPGVYAISVTWAEDGRFRAGTWHVELRPGPVQEVPRLLAAVRGWSRYAGASGLILGTTFPVGDGLGCDGPSVDERPGVIGLAHGLDEAFAPITARAIFPGGRSRDQPLLSTGQVVPGLTVLAPADGRDFALGTYRFTFGDGPGARRMTVCLGPAPFDG